MHVFGPVFAFFFSTVLSNTLYADSSNLAESQATAVCSNPAPVLIVDTFDGDQTNQRDIDLNGDGEFDTYHGELTEKLVQLNGQKTLRLNVSTPVFTVQLRQRLSEVLKDVESGQLSLSWINFSQGYSVSFGDLQRFVDLKTEGRLGPDNIKELAPKILQRLWTAYPKLEIESLKQIFEGFGRLGIPIVIAAGNSGFNEINFYSLFPNIITVGAVGMTGSPTQYTSNHGLISLWRLGDIRSYATTEGIDLNGDRKADFPITTAVLQETDLAQINGRLGYEIVTPLPAYIAQGNNPNTATFTELVAKLPPGLYDTRKVLAQALNTPNYQARYLCDLGDYFFVDGRSSSATLFVRTRTDDRISLDPQEMDENYQLRVLIRGTSFAAPNLCRQTFPISTN